MTPPGAVVPVEQLAFYRARRAIFDEASRGNAIARKRAEDATSLLLREYMILSENHPLMRAQTVSCLEAVEGKSGAVTLKVCDRTKYDSLQESIKSTEERLATLAGAIRELDALGPDVLLEELRTTKAALESVEGQQMGVLNTWASSAIQRGANSRRSVEDILRTDQLYQEHKAKAETQIATAKKNLALVAPVLEKVEAILAAVAP